MNGLKVGLTPVNVISGNKVNFAFSTVEKAKDPLQKCFSSF